MHSCVYEFFRDQGSIIAGLLALAAGILAYRAGISQARSLREQLRYMKTAAAESDRRAREDLLTAYDAVAVRITTHVEEQQELAKKHSSSGMHRNVAPIFQRSFRISEIHLEGLAISTIVYVGIRLAAIELRASVDELNSLIDVKGPADEVPWNELIEALNNVRNRAVELHGAIEHEAAPP